MSDLSEQFDQAFAEWDQLVNKGGTHGTNGSLLRRKVKPKTKKSKKS